MRILDLAPAPLFPCARDGERQQAARLRVDATAAGHVTVLASTPDGRSAATPLDVVEGDASHDVLIPEVKSPGGVDVRIADPEGREVAARSFDCTPSRKWTVYAMPTGHIDLYSTGLAHETPEEHARMLDAALALSEEFPEYRYQLENTLPLFEFRELRGERAMRRLAERIREGRIAFGAQYTGVHMEETSGEELVQGQLLPLRELEAQYGIRPNCAYTVDVPNTTVQYAQLVARCGISGWIFSPNRYPPPNGWYGLGESIRLLPRLMRARGRDGSGVLTWLPHEHYGEDQRLFGLDSGGIDAAAASVSRQLAALEHEGYPWDAYLLEHSYGDNLPPTGDLPLLLRAWNERYAYPRLVLATADEFFQHVQGASPQPPEMRLQVLDVWAYIVANQGVLNQIARRASQRLLSAQALSAFGDCAGYAEGRLRAAFADLAKFAGHDWWYGGGQVAGVPDLAKAAWVHAAAETADQLLESAGAGAPAAVGNACAFERRELVLAPAGSGARGQCIDAADAATHFRPHAYTIAHPEDAPAEQDAVAFVADLPALAPAPLEPGPRQPSRRHHDAVIESPFYRVEFDPALGAIVSVTDRESGRELVDSRRYGLAQLLVGRPQYDGFGIGFGVTREQAIERMRQSLREWEPCRLEGDGGLRGPVFSSLLLRGQAGSSPVTQAVVLYDDLKRIDITISIEWDNQPSACRLVAAFPFALSPFTARYEVPFGVLEVGRDETPTRPRHLRQLQTWLQLREGERCVVVASPDAGVFSLGRCDLNPIDDGEHTVPNDASAFFVLADNGAPSPLVQPGRIAARFSLTTGGGLRPSDCARFAWGFARPPLPSSRAAAPGIRVEPDCVLISAVKRAWDGSGLVVRVVEYDGIEAEAVLRLPFRPRAACLADPVEHPLEPLPVDGYIIRFPVRPHEVLTLLIER